MRGRLALLASAVGNVVGAYAASVDVFVGTAELGHLTPAAACPFGFVQAGPDTSERPDKFVSDWRHCAGYQHADPYVWRFSQTHLFGTGCLALGDVAVMPCVEGFDVVSVPARKVKDSERGEPGFYAVALDEGDVRIGCEVVARPHAAVYRFTWPSNSVARLLVDMDWGLGCVDDDKCFAKNVRSATCKITDLPSKDVSGGHRIWTWNDYEVHFAMSLSVPVRVVRTRREADGVRGVIRELDFGRLADGVLEVRIGLSSHSSEAAKRNLQSETSGRDFAELRRISAAEWSELLGRVELGEETPSDVRANFMSALYRAMIQPNDLGDVGEKPVYSTFSLWDTFRAAHPLYTLLTPERVPDFVTSLLDQCDRQGYLPIWSLGCGENHCMIGHHAVPVIVDACLKGLVPLEQVERAYRAVRQSLTVNHKPVNDGTWGLVKEDWDVLDRYGYYPFDKLSGWYEGRHVIGESVSRTVECAYDDACAARLATALGRTKDAAYFSRRAQNWRNVYDASVGFVRGKDSQGKWREPFNPFDIGLGPWLKNDFCEGNAYQYTWHVLHDPVGLVELLGGRRRAGERLDELFSARSASVDEASGDLNCTGCIGQYAHGNEPSHHIAYLYAYTDRPHRAADVIRQICMTQYFPRPNGLCGNDDCGQMAAWYVFSVLGFYPVDPCGGDYVIGAPQVPHAVVKFGAGRTLTVVARNLSSENRYVKSVTLDGKRIEGLVMRHADIVRGGTLEFEMGLAQ